MKVELDLSSYATKADLKHVTSADASEFSKTFDEASLKSDVDKLGINKLKNVPINLSNFKSKVDKLDVDKLVPVSVDLSKLSDAVKSDVIEKDVCNAQIKNIEYKILDITKLATNTTIKAKINEVKNEISSITKLATTTALNAKTNEVKKKNPNITSYFYCSCWCGNLFKKTDYNTNINETENKITDHYHDKYIATQEFNKLAAEDFTASLAQANL